MEPRLNAELRHHGKGAGVIFSGEPHPDDSVCILRPTSEDSLASWTVALCGPAGTCYAGGIFLLSMEVPTNYPFRPPKLRFITPVYHPNVNMRTGEIDLDILGSQFSPTLTVLHYVMSLSALLSAPTFDLSCWQVLHHEAVSEADRAAMHAQIRLGQRDLPAWEANARAHTANHALPLAVSDTGVLRMLHGSAAFALRAGERASERADGHMRLGSFVAFLLWAAKHTPLALPSEVWLAHIIPLVLRPRITPSRALADAAEVPEEAFERYWRASRKECSRLRDGEAHE